MGRGRVAVMVADVAVSSAAEAHSLHSLFDILNSIVTLVITSSSSSLMIPVLIAAVIVRLSLRVSSSGGTSTSVTVVHLLRSP